MPALDLFINGRDYRIACGEGEEGHLRMLADEIDGRTRQLASRMGQGSDGILLVMAALMMADELNDVRKEVGALRRELEMTADTHERGKIEEMETAVSYTIEQIAARVEKIAERLETA